jgi:hypothetical protein
MLAPAGQNANMVVHRLRHQPLLQLRLAALCKILVDQGVPLASNVENVKGIVTGTLIVKAA